jgi:hypothetical protein
MAGETFLVNFPSSFFLAPLSALFCAARLLWSGKISGLTDAFDSFDLQSNFSSLTLSLVDRLSANNSFTRPQEVSLTGLKYYITHTIAALKSNNSTVNIDRCLMHFQRSTFPSCPRRTRAPLFCLKESITSHKMPEH